MFLKWVVCAFATVFLVGVSQAAPPGVEWYHFGLIADMDKKSIASDKTTFNSVLKIDELRHNTKTDQYIYVRSRVKKPVSTRYGFKGRGAELSEIVVFNNKLYTVDDKSGITFRITKDGKLFPWVILADADGQRPDGFKGEWATIKDDTIYVGSTGMLKFTSSLWVKKITKDGVVTSHDWTDKYRKILKALNMPNGFVWHEAVTWSPFRKQWVFMPRKCSRHPFSQELEERTGCNKIVTADENFNDIQVIHIQDQPYNLASGFSSFRFIPGTKNERLLALRTVEQEDQVKTWAVVMDMKGTVLMYEKELYDEKFEGLAFFGGIKKN